MLEQFTTHMGIAESNLLFFWTDAHTVDDSLASCAKGQSPDELHSVPSGIPKVDCIDTHSVMFHT